MPSDNSPKTGADEETVLLTGPDGSTYRIPADQLQRFKLAAVEPAPEEPPPAPAAPPPPRETIAGSTRGGSHAPPLASRERMGSSYIAITFRAVSPEIFSNRVARIDAVPATEIISRRSRELPWYERDTLFGRELACRVVIWVHEALATSEVAQAQVEQHPYRKIQIYTRDYQIPAALAELIDAFGGECSLVESGHLNFTTRRYESELRDQLVAELVAEAGPLARCEFGVTDERLIGRIEGSIPTVHELERRVQRSGLVDREDLRVEYD